MAPGVLLDDEQEYVTFHANKGKLSRPVLKGDARVKTFDTIPQIDVSRMWSASLEDRKAVAQEVGTTFRDAGFMCAINHGISEDLQNRMYRVIKEFFDQPLNEKMKIHVNNSPAIKGYEALLETRLDESTRGDCKEALATSTDPDDPIYECPEDFDKSFYKARPINQWPEVPSDYKAVHDEYRAAVLKISKQFLRICALALVLEENYFDHMTRFPMAGLRALHYPPQPRADDVGIGAHNDYTWFTLLWQITPAPALQVLNKNGEWVSAPPIPGALTVNVGDMLERATNDEFVSTVHRVINKTGEERYSLAYFFTPSHDVTIETVPTCWGSDRPKKYEDVNAGDWQRERLLRARYKHPASVAARANGTA